MFEWDREFVIWLNQFVRQSWTFDQSVYILATNSEFKGYVVAAVLLWLWFQKGPGMETRRKKLLALLLGCLAAVLAGRLLQLGLPHVPRPKNDPGLGFVLPHGVEAEALAGWNAFPSDHATLFFGAAAGLWWVSRRWGTFVLVYIFLVVGIGRIYIGYHYPSDILGGGLLGGLVAMGFVKTPCLERVTQPLLDCGRRFPRAFYAGFFFIVYQLAILFVHLRDLAQWAWAAVWKVIGV